MTDPQLEHLTQFIEDIRQTIPLSRAWITKRKAMYMLEQLRIKFVQMELNGEEFTIDQQALYILLMILIELRKGN